MQTILEPPPVPLLERLRDATADLHSRLEDGLGLLAPPLDQARLTFLIERFYGFHAAWEPGAARWIGDTDFLGPRQRASLAALDLVALGHSCDVIEALPICPEAAAFASAAEAWGSVYVMEGSTLGGKIISRRLAQEEWLPEGGLRYFDPHGQSTGVLWRAVKDRLAGLPAAEEPAVVRGARLTFTRLATWLKPAFRG